MPPPNRHPYVPGTKEIGKKVGDAIKALEVGHYEIVDENQNARTFESLGVFTMGEVLEHVLEFLDEIQALGPKECYCGIGGRVEFSNKRGYSDVRLYAYSWLSTKMVKWMYLKFGLRKRGSEISFTYIHLSCHDHETTSI
ncbi:hypothetical protein HQ447_10530 [bacterium]|nr:hypothetical protein [bacterium]